MKYEHWRLYAWMNYSIIDIDKTVRLQLIYFLYSYQNRNAVNTDDPILHFL